MVWYVGAIWCHGSPWKSGGAPGQSRNHRNLWDTMETYRSLGPATFPLLFRNTCFCHVLIYEFYIANICFLMAKSCIEQPCCLVLVFPSRSHNGSACRAFCCDCPATTISHMLSRQFLLATYLPFAKVVIQLVNWLCIDRCINIRTCWKLFETNCEPS